MDGDGLGEVVREAVDDHLAQFGMGMSDRPVVRHHPLPSQSRHPRPTQVLNSDNESAYLLARRSIHVWPLDSPTPEGFCGYARRFLQLTEEEMKAINVESVTAVNKSPLSKIQKEFVIRFSTIQDLSLIHI